MDDADRFLAQCVADGRITKEEVADVSQYRSGRCQCPGKLISLGDFVDRVCTEMGVPRRDAAKMLAVHLYDVQLTATHLVLYVNYPTWTYQELADLFRIPRETVRDRIAAVRKAWPSLRFDVSEGKYGVPALNAMQRITYSDSSRLNDDGSLIKF